VLLLAGTFEPFDEDKASAAGADSWITKPFESQTLIERVEELLAKADAAPPISSQVAAVPAAAIEATEEELVAAVVAEEQAEPEASQEVPAIDLAEAMAVDSEPADADIWDAVAFDDDDLLEEAPVVEDAQVVEETESEAAASAIAEEVAEEVAEETPERPPVAPIDQAPAADEDIWELDDEDIFDLDEEDLLIEEDQPVAAEEVAVSSEPVAPAPFSFDVEPEEEAPSATASEPAVDVAAPAAIEAESVDEEDIWSEAAASDDDIWKEVEPFAADEPSAVEEIPSETSELPEPAVEPVVEFESEPEASIPASPAETPVLGDASGSFDNDLGEAFGFSEAEETTEVSVEEPAATGAEWTSSEVESETADLASEPDPGSVAEPVESETEVARQVAAIDDARLEEIVERVAGQVIEKLAGSLLERIAWEVVPDLAESLVKEEIRQLKDAANDS